MKAPLILLILAAIAFAGFRPASKPVHIKGHLKKNNSQPGDLTHINDLSVFVKGDGRILAKAISDEKGDFSLTFTPGNEKSFDFFCTGPGIDSLLIGSVQTFESDTPDMVFMIPATPEKNAAGKPICLKCRKADKVYQIVYGDGIADRFDYDDSPVHTNPRIVDGKYQAGTCIVDNASYYCDRDKVKF